MILQFFGERVHLGLYLMHGLEAMAFRWEQQKKDAEVVTVTKKERSPFGNVMRDFFMQELTKLLAFFSFFRQRHGEADPRFAVIKTVKSAKGLELVQAAASAAVKQRL